MEQAELLRYVLGVLQGRSIPYMVVGSVASSAYGEPRATLDIDIVVELRADQVRSLCSAFPSEEFYLSTEAALEAVARKDQFNLIHAASGNKVDFFVARPDEWGTEQLARRQKVQILPDLQGYLARPEDVILGKMRYYSEGGSDRHLRDVAGIMKVSGSDVDQAYVERWAARLGLAQIWEGILRRLDERA